MFGTFLVPSLLFSYFASKNCFSYNEADKKIISPKLIGYVVILSLFILPIITYLGYLNELISLPESMQKIEIWMQEMEKSNRALMQTLTANSNGIILLINILAMALLPAIFEEFLFRGTLQQFFSKWFANKHVAIIVTAFIFSAIHFQFYGFIPRFLLGIYLGYLFVWGRSLWLPIVAHFMHNAISLILDYIARYRGIDLETVDPSQITGFYPTVIFCTLFVGLGVYFVRRFSQISTENKSVKICENL
jgi:membrane protease YdiL (CAAX protease family)